MAHRIQIFDEIDSQMLKRIYDETSTLEDNSDIELVISSYGGAILDAIGIIDMLKRFNTTANVLGFACSAAAIIAVSCKNVIMSENASMLIHSAWAEDVDSDDSGIVRCNKVQLDIIKHRCPEFDPKCIQSDTWLSANECLQLGLIDNIYNNESVDYKALSLKYAAKLAAITNKEVTMPEDAKDKMIEEIKESEEVKAEEAEAEEKIEEPKAEESEEPKTEESEEPKAEESEEPKAEENPESENATVLKVLEAISTRLDELNNRIAALEEAKEPKAEEVEVEEVTEQDRINNIYNNIVQPQARLAIGTPKAMKVVHKVDYKSFGSFLND